MKLNITASAARLRRLLSAGALALGLTATTFAQGTAFTYQGRLTDGVNPATGTYDFQFTLYDSADGVGTVGSPVPKLGVGVTNGLFTVALDFGAGLFNGAARWLEIAARTNGAATYVTLTPRQPLTPTPYAFYAPNAGAAGSVPASGLTGTVALSQLPPAVLTNNASGVQLTGSFTGNGAGLTSLNANNLSSGTLPDARLSANVALLNANQTFTGQSSFSQNVGIGTSSPGKRLTVAGDMEVGTSSGDYHHLRLGGGNASGYLYGSFAGLGDGLSLGYNYYYDGAGVGHCDNTNGSTSRLTVSYGNIILATGAANTAPSPRLLVNYAGNVGIDTLYPRTALEVNGTILANSFSGSFAGDGAGLTNLSTTALTGTVPLAQLPGAVVTNNETGVTLSGTFSGNGAALTNIPATALAPPPPGMVLIPAGAFTMGDTLDGMGDAGPISTTVSAFYMDVNLVSLSQWQSVYYWATNQGYRFVNVGAGKAANHPVQTVKWYDCVKWCNARSQQAGRMPVYYTDAAFTQVYTNDEPPTLYPHWTASGYRLPTEAEWEKAARGGLSGQRFPWGNVINQNLANYYGATGNFSYDLGPNGYNPIWNVGGAPLTSPIGSFAANGYGLNDMAGNVSQWCWDWYATSYAGGSNPHGPAGPLGYRVLRGGSWNFLADFARCAYRNYNYPNYAYNPAGFRCVRGL